MCLYLHELLRWFFLPVRFYFELLLGHALSFGLFWLLPRNIWQAPFAVLVSALPYFVLGVSFRLLVKRTRAATAEDPRGKPAPALRAFAYVSSLSFPVFLLAL